MYRPDYCLLQPSRYLQSLFVLVAGLALLAIGLAAIPVWLQLPLMVAVVVYTAYLIRRYARLSLPLSVVAIYWDEQGWQLRLRSGDKLEVLPGDQRFFGEQLLLLEFSCERQRFTVPLFADAWACSESESNAGPTAGKVPASLRRLRVCLIHGSHRSAVRQTAA